MAEKDEELGLSPAQRDLIMALADERTVAGAARRAGVARSSVYMWLQDPVFRAEVGRVRGLLYQEALDLLNGGMAKAIGKLIESLDHGSSSIRLKAASEIARLGMEMRRDVETEAKLRELEERAGPLLKARSGGGG